jgi:PKD repeat protein
MKRRFTLLSIFLALSCFTGLFAASGGPDAYGYIWRDSNEPNGPTVNWMDTTSMWTRVNGLADDNSVGTFNMFWDFHYYWGDYRNIKIGSNGWVAFDNVNNLASCFPNIPTSGGAGDNYLAALMSDLTFTSSFPQFPNVGKCYYWSNLKDTTVISYYNVPFWQAGTPDWVGSNTFQIFLDGNDSSITFTYKTMNPTFSVACGTDLVIGIENSTGAVGLQCFTQTMPPSLYAIKFKYPPVPLLAVRDLAPLWNQNNKNAGEFFPTGLIPTLQSHVKNVGNTAFTTNSTVNGNLRNMSMASVYTASRTMPTWAAGVDTTLVFTPQAVVNTAGQYYWEVTSNNGADMNNGNNINTSEIQLVNLLGPTATLTYTTGGGNTMAWGWNGGGIDDGVGVYMNPPVHPASIQNVQVFIAAASFSGYIISLWDDSGPNGAPGALLRTDTIPFSSVSVGNWNTVNYSIPVNVGSGGFYVAWMMGGADIFLGTENVGPISRRTYEILGGQWSGFRDNNLREAMVRVVIGNYPCAISSNFSYTSNFATVNFSNQSQGGTTYSWNFGDGGTSTQLSPSHTYSTFGTYNVCLISTNTCGSDTFCMPITVNCPSPAASFNFVRNGFNVAFTDATGGNPNIWLWDFGDGSTSTQQNPSHTYATAGNYTICLISTNPCGSDTSCQSLVVCNVPVANFNFTTNGLSATFNNVSTNGTTYFWNFGDGVNSAQQNPTHAYATAGTYNVCLITSNPCYMDTFCSQVTICPLPVVNFSFVPSQFSVAFSDNTAGANTAWSWSFGDGGTSTQQNPNHTYTANGTYQVCLTVTNSCGPDSSCQSVTINVVALQDALQNSLVLWPNPAQNQLSMRMTVPSPVNLRLRIYDMTGRTAGEQEIVANSTEWGTTLDISPLSAGMYMVAIEGEGIQILRKFIKE